MSIVEICAVIAVLLLGLITMMLFSLCAAHLPNKEQIGATLRNIRKSKSDSQVCGVCGGLGQSTFIPSWLWRVAFLILAFCGGFGVIGYIIMAICMPDANAPVPENEKPGV